VEVARHWIQKLQYSKVVAVVSGGKERSDSVQEGLKVVAPNTRWIAIHDGARPFVTSELISRVLSAARACGAAIPVLPVTDTIKEILNNKIIATIPRKQLYGAQTPQVFDRQRLLEAYQKVKEKKYIATDDAEVVQHFTSGSIAIILGEENNFKITTPADWERAEDLWKRNSTLQTKDT
jgi:2-C-methyl-D-erythritol 4-phosphate cytidylyltransferase